MYQALLTRRYLTSKLMPLLSALAVLLCTMMVLIVWSIMGGFLTMLLASGRTLIGDASIQWPTSGFAYYDELIARLEKDPVIAAATPVIESFGSIILPDGRNEGITIRGIDGPSYARVADYAAALWWKPMTTPLRKDTARRDPRLDPTVFDWPTLYHDGLTLKEMDLVTKQERPAVVLGSEVTGYNERLVSGVYLPHPYGRRTESGRIEYTAKFMPMGSITITVAPMNRAGRPTDVVTRTLPVANEFKSGLYEIDSHTVLIELSELQRMLKMDAAAKLKPGPATSRYDVVIGPDGKEQLREPEVMGIDPARVTTVLVRAKEGHTADEAAARAREVYAEFEAAHRGEVPPPPGSTGSIVIRTWKESQGMMVEAVEHEIGMVLFIEGIISFVSSFLILAIFWGMVSEKTKDIGVLRAVGAGRVGVAWLWLRYGLAIGVVGSLLGGVAACLIVWNINPIHDWMGRVLHMTLWNPKVYYFSEIPHDVDPRKAAVIVGSGIVFSVLGALIPAVRAANMDPVKALRFE